MNRPFLIRTMTGEHYWLQDWTFSTSTFEASVPVHTPAPSLKEQFQQAHPGLFDASLLTANGGTVNDFADTYEFLLATGEGGALDTRMDSEDMARMLGRFDGHGRFNPALTQYPKALLTDKMKSRLTSFTGGKIWSADVETTFVKVLKPAQKEAWVKLACQSLEQDAASATIDRLEREHDAYTRQRQASAEEHPDLEKERYGHLPLLPAQRPGTPPQRYEAVHKHLPIELILVWKPAGPGASTAGVAAAAQPAAGVGPASDTAAMPRPLVVTSGPIHHHAFDQANQAAEAEPVKELALAHLDSL